MRPAVVILVLFLSGLAAGCLGGGNPQDTGESGGAGAALSPGAGLNRDLLSTDQHTIMPVVHDYVRARLDGILLHVEIFLPNGPGPWPTILENSPYNGQNPCQLGTPVVVCSAPSLANRYVPKGYAVVYADVRGTAESEGCMNMMGAKEQSDTYDLVEWIAAQKWSDGNVGMQGVSYVGTTPHEAMIQSPPHLRAVATIAGVTNQWRNMYQNGVPYQGRFYPLTYEVLEGAPPPLDVRRGPSWALNAAAGACEQEEMAEHVRPGVYEKGIYDDYWAERNFTRFAANVTVPMLYSQGFIDRAVNPMEAVYWFNDIGGPKKGFFHQEGHRYVNREDYFDTELAWFDHYLKGIDNGVDRMPIVEVLTNTGKIRLDSHWPPIDTRPLSLNLTATGLSMLPVDAGQQAYFAALVPNVTGPAGTGTGPLVSGAGRPTTLQFRGDALQEDLYMAGSAVMHLRASSDQTNTYFLFQLFDVDGAGVKRSIAEGWFNAHLREGFDRSAPLTPGTQYDFTFKFEPREWVFQANHAVHLEVWGSDGRVLPYDTLAATNTLYFGPGGSWLELPILSAPKLFDRPEGI